MARLITSEFQKWKLTPEEITAGTLLSDLQKMVLHNLRTEIMLEKCSLTFEENNKNRFIELQGQLGILNMLLTLSEELEVRMKVEAEVNAQFPRN